MKLGELFYAIGLEVDDGKFEEFDKKVQNAKKNLALFTAEVTGALYAIDRFVDSSVRGAVALANFALQTGLSTERLQKWQFAATLSNIAMSADDVTSSIKSLQDNLTSIRMGGGNAAPFQLLGIDIQGKDAFQVLEQLREKIKGLDPSVAANLIKQTGLNEGFINVLRLSNSEFEKLGSGLSRSSKTLDALSRVGVAVRTLKENFKLFKDETVANLEPVWNRLIEFLYTALQLIQSLGAGIGMLAREWANLSESTKEWVKIFGAALLTILMPIRAMLLGILLLIDDFIAYKSGGNSVIGKIKGWWDNDKEEKPKEQFDSFNNDQPKADPNFKPDVAYKPAERKKLFGWDVPTIDDLAETMRQKGKGELPNTPIPEGEKIIYKENLPLPMPGSMQDINEKLKNLQMNENEIERTNAMREITERMMKLDPERTIKEAVPILDKATKNMEINQNNTYHIQGANSQDIADTIVDKTQNHLNQSLADTGNQAAF